MNRSIRRNYAFSQREVREILIWWMKEKDLQRPQYVGDTPDTSWAATADGGISVSWLADDQVDLETGKTLP